MFILLNALYDIKNGVDFGLNSADPFAKKDWYDIKAPSIFNVRQVGKTLVTRTQGTKVRFMFDDYLCEMAILIF